MLDMDKWLQLAESWLANLLNWFTDPVFYAQIGAIIGAIFVAYILSGQIRKKVPLFSTEPGEGRFQRVLAIIYNFRDLLFPLLAVACLAVAVEACLATVQSAWLVTSIHITSHSILPLHMPT